MQISTRHIATIGLAAAAVLLTGCGGDTPRATPSTPTVTRTVTTTPSETAAAPATADDATAQDTDTAAPVTTAADTPCGPYADAAAKISAASARIAPPSSQFDWTWAPIRSDMTSCNQLSWAELTTAHGTASSSDQLLLFGPDGRWLGTGIRCNAGLASVTGSGPDHVDVHYGYFHGKNTSTANPGGGTDVTFRWNGSRVVMEGVLPQEFLDQCQRPS
ncbi:LppP/LprE family lipoprotein [Williamsia deligens]|uniref:LppP/LprE family lipoprotein n=1 Tax=Williamsia deligens TaxID=321325 RepID=A0ABW3GAX4_9NOCA|nr:LppP/LprE family lipoprotein [Williamsia deligens]MCP2192420.1 LppP/LprE lipoprotein [Williamsia deligens]